MHQKFYPEVKVRFSYGKKRIDLTLDDLFEANENYDETKNILMESAIEQLNSYVPTYQPVAYNSGHTYKRNGYYDNYKPGTHLGGGSYFGNEGSGYAGYEYDWDDDTYHGSSIYSSDRQVEANERVTSGIVIRCDKCGKFTNTTKAKKVRGKSLCLDCITDEQDAEQNTISSKHYNNRQPFKKSEATSIGEALLSYIGRSNGEVKNLSSLKKLQDFLSELREG